MKSYNYLKTKTMRNLKRRVGEVTIATNLDSHKLKDGRHTVRIRAQYLGASRYYSTHVSMTPGEYEKYCKNPTEECDITRQFNQFFEAALLLVKEECFSFSRLLVQVSRSKANSIQEQIQFKIDSLRKDSKYSTAIMYNDLLTAVNGFLKGKKMPIGRITQDTCLDFIKYLETERKNNPTTINIRLRNLSAIMQDAIRCHLLKKIL